MRLIPLAALSLTLATPALAETQLERMERLSEAMQVKMFSTMLQGTDFDVASAVAWDDEMRASAECVLDAYVAESSEEDLEAVFDQMEEIIAQPAADMAAMEEQMSNFAAPLPEERAIEINRSCGMVDLQMQKMQESGLMNAMMQAQMQSQGN